MAPSIFILLHRSADSVTSILSVFLELADANEACLARAKEAKVDPAGTANVNEPLRWEAPDGESAWVEKHAVTLRKNLKPALPNGGVQRKGSQLYDSDEDDGIEVHDNDGHYD